VTLITGTIAQGGIAAASMLFLSAPSPWLTLAAGGVVLSASLPWRVGDASVGKERSITTAVFSLPVSLL